MVRETRVQKKKRRLRLYRRIAILIIVLGLGVFWSLRTKFLQIKEISAEGNSKLTIEDIVNTSGIREGDNIIRVGTGSAAESILELPYVREVKVKRKLPGTISIQVVERKPYMQFEYNYSFAVVDMEGILLEYSTRRNSEIPNVIGFDWEQIKPGESILENPLGIELKDFFNDEEIEKIVLNFRNMGYDEENNIKFNLFNGMTVEFGPLDNVKYKLRVLQEIVQDVEEKNIPTKMIIMNKGEHPIVVRDEK